MARRIVVDYVGQVRDFRYFVEDAAAGALRPSHQVPLALLTPERRRQIGVGSREMPLYAGTEHSGAWHAWIRHGPESGEKGCSSG